MIQHSTEMATCFILLGIQTFA